jgi:hypothetical protein
MADILEDIARKLKTLRDSLPELIIETVEEAAPQLEDLVIAQLYSGIDAEGKRIEPEYTPFTKEIKKAKGQPIDRVTTRDTGDFHSSIYQKISGTKVEYDARDRKYGKLSEKYSPDLLGLTEQSQEIAKAEILAPILYDKLKTFAGQ